MLRKKKDDKTEEFKRDMTLTEQQRQTPMTEDYVYSLGRSVYMIMDPEVTAMLNPTDDNGKPKPSQFRSLIPAFSHLNRLSNIDKQQKELLTLDYEFLILIHKLNMNEDQYESVGWAELESLKIFAQNMVSDSFHGWKGKLVTEQIKIIRAELEKKKKGLLPF